MKNVGLIVRCVRSVLTGIFQWRARPEERQPEGEVVANDLTAVVPYTDAQIETAKEQLHHMEMLLVNFAIDAAKQAHTSPQSARESVQFVREMRSCIDDLRALLVGSEAGRR